MEISPPTTKDELNSFLGFINTFKIWSPALNPHSPTLRDLGRKETIFPWTTEAQKEFDQLKQDLQSILEINPYDPSIPITVCTDASYSGGFGFVCGQSLPNGQFNVLQVGSTGLTPLQKNYSCYELELVAIRLASKKAYHFPAHSPHPVLFLTDHASLAIWNQCNLTLSKPPEF